MAMKLKVATDRLEVLEGEHRVEKEGLKKAGAEVKDARSEMRAMKEELRQAGDIAAGKPFLLCRKFTEVCSVGPIVGDGGSLSGFGGECSGRSSALPKSEGS